MARQEFDNAPENDLLHSTTLRHLIQQGDYNELIWRTMGRLEKMARVMLSRFPGVKHQYQTDDVLQNSLMRLLRALQVLRPSSTREFYGLAATQIRRELLDLYRHLRARQDIQMNDLPLRERSDSALGYEPADTTPSQEELERWSAFHEAVVELPVAEREVIGLTFYHGWTQMQIAELLQISDRQVRRLWKSACAQLMTRLGGDLPNWFSHS